MVIYGAALIGVCYIIGNFLGELLGALLGLDCNIGGVAFAMILLILVTSVLKKKGKINKETDEGIHFWQRMYIPVVVAMTASQDVFSALSSGITPILAGVLIVAGSFAILPILSKERKTNESEK